MVASILYRSHSPVELGRLLHLEQVHRIGRPSIGPKDPLAKERIVDGHLLHLGHDLLGILALQGVNRLEVVRRFEYAPACELVGIRPPNCAAKRFENARV